MKSRREMMEGARKNEADNYANVVVAQTQPPPQPVVYMQPVVMQPAGYAPQQQPTYPPPGTYAPQQPAYPPPGTYAPPPPGPSYPPPTAGYPAVVQ